jgi:Zn-finger nucleic acid-binding protein
MGLEPIAAPGGAALPCPSCEHGLEPFRGGPGKLLDCNGCGGQFVEHALLRELLERREILGRAVPDHAQRQNPLTQRVRYLPCPACENLMNRHNFGGTSGIIVDVCRQHGTWYDAGELPRVLAFVQSGGLERARLFEREAQRRRELAATGAPAPMSLSRITGDTSLAADVAAAAAALLAHVTNLIRR